MNSHLEKKTLFTLMIHEPKPNKRALIKLWNTLFFNMTCHLLVCTVQSYPNEKVDKNTHTHIPKRIIRIKRRRMDTRKQTSWPSKIPMKWTFAARIQCSVFCWRLILAISSKFHHMKEYYSFLLNTLKISSSIFLSSSTVFFKW